MIINQLIDSIINYSFFNSPCYLVSLFVSPFLRSLTELESDLVTYGGLSYLVSLIYELAWVVSYQIYFPLQGCIINVIINKLLFFTSLVSTLIIPLSIFLMHACEKHLVARSLSCVSTWYQSLNFYMVSKQRLLNL